MNAAVALLSFFVYAKPDASGQLAYDYKPVCLCILYCFISSFMGNNLILGTKRACEFTVITPHAEEITKEVMEKLRHGSTQITALGAYNRQERNLLICVVNKHQVADFKRILENYQDTFAFSETVDEIYGNFKRVK